MYTEGRPYSRRSRGAPTEIENTESSDIFIMGGTLMSGGFVLKKCRRMNVDLISALPDDVLVYILSFLQLNQAASTGLLSRRWLHLWKHTPKLIFRNYRLWLTEDTSRYVNWVNSVLNLHKGDLQEFTIAFCATKSNRHDVAKWLDFAFSRRVERLNFHLYDLNRCDAALLEEILEDITLPSRTATQSLRVLCLAKTQTSAAAIQFFLRNCPMLEQLVIEDVITSSDLEVVGPSLKHLDIQSKNKSISIEVSTPNLTSLKIDCDTRRLFLKNVPKLLHISFFCRVDRTMHYFGTAASQLETLTISMDRPQASFSVPEMPKLKKVVLDDRKHLPLGPLVPFSVTSFLRASPCLEEFEVEITGITLEEGVSEFPKVGPLFQHSSLKRFKLLWFCGGSPCDDRIRLVRYVVDNCVALEEIEISQCDKELRWRNCYVVVVDCCVRVATTEERMAFEKAIQRQLPAHIRLRIVNHFHKSPFVSQHCDKL